MPERTTYAIDFGTSNSLICAVHNGVASEPLAIDPSARDSSVLRSLMYFGGSGQTSFGQKAIDQYAEESGEGRFLRSFKKFLPVESFTSTRIANQSYSLEDLISRFLREMKMRADQLVGSDVTSVVLGRPARFSPDDSKDKLAQNRLKRSAEMAGFKKIEFFAEPLAAAFDYRLQLQKEKTALVVDLGGGTSDFTVIRIHPKEQRSGDVLALGGVSIAGDSIDGELMAKKIAFHFGSEARYRMPLGSNVLTMPPSLKFSLMSPADITLLSRSDVMGFLKEVQKCVLGEEDQKRFQQLLSLVHHNLGFSIFEAIEKWKREVCETGRSEFAFIDDDISVAESLQEVEFREISKDKVEQIFACLDDVVRESGVSPKQIDTICCTGGTSKLPAIKEGLAERFGSEKLQSLSSFHSVIKGLAERAKGI